MDKYDIEELKRLLMKNDLEKLSQLMKEKFYYEMKTHSTGEIESIEFFIWEHFKGEISWCHLHFKENNWFVDVLTRTKVNDEELELMKKVYDEFIKHCGETNEV